MSVVRAVALAAATSVLLAAPAMAAEPGDPGLCDQTVIVDPATLLDSAGTEALTDAAESLAAAADATVHAVLLSDTGGTGIDAWADGQLAVCESWQRPDGESLDRLLVLAVSLDDRETGSYYGLELAPQLNGERDRVHDRTMAPFLRDGQFAEALVQGLRDYETVLASNSSSGPSAPSQPDATAVPSTPAPRSPVSDRPAPAGEDASSVPVPVVERPTPNSEVPGGWFLLGLLGLGAVGVGGPPMVGAIQRRHDERRRRAALLAEATSDQAMARSTYFDLNQQWSATHDETVVMLGTLDRRDRLAVELSREIDEAEATLASLGAAIADATDPADDDRLEEVAEVWSRNAELAAAAEREVDEVAAHVAEIEQARATLADDIAGAHDALADVTGRVDRALADGQRVDVPREFLEGAAAALVHAESVDATKQIGAATDATSRAAALTTQAEEVLERHAVLRATLPDRHEAATSRVAKVHEQAGSVLPLLAGLRDRWARAVWDDVADGEAEYDELRAVTLRLLSEASAHIADGEYDAATDRLDRADEGLRQLAATLDEIEDRHQDVEAAAAAWDDASAAADAALETASAYLVKHQTPAEFDTKLSAATRQRDDAVVALRGGDPLTAVERAHAAERAASDVFDAARRDVERRRRQASEALAAAERHLKRARSYRRTYGFADDINHLSRRHAAVQSLLANGAYDEAVRRSADLSREADRVADLVRAEYQAAQRSLHRSSSSFGSSSFGGGGSSSFGSSSFGGGGSSSFGGGGGSFGGGGSSGW